MEDKVRLWLARGCRMVWLVWPRVQTIEVWLRGQAAPHQTLRPGDELDGGDVLPGFRCSLGRVFRQS
jgi:Uma2 family endonuclease